MSNVRINIIAIALPNNFVQGWHVSLNIILLLLSDWPHANLLSNYIFFIFVSYFHIAIFLVIKFYLTKILYFSFYIYLLLNAIFFCRVVNLLSLSFFFKKQKPLPISRQYNWLNIKTITLCYFDRLALLACFCLCVALVAMSEMVSCWFMHNFPWFSSGNTFRVLCLVILWLGK